MPYRFTPGYQPRKSAVSGRKTAIIEVNRKRTAKAQGST